MKQLLLLITFLLLLVSCTGGREERVVATVGTHDIKWKAVKDFAYSFKQSHPDIDSNMELFKEDVINSYVVPAMQSLDSQKSRQDNANLNLRKRVMFEEACVTVLGSRICDRVEFETRVYRIFYVSFKFHGLDDEQELENELDSYAGNLLKTISRIKNPDHLRSVLTRDDGERRWTRQFGIKDYFLLQDVPPEVGILLDEMEPGLYYPEPITIKGYGSMLVKLLDTRIVNEKSIERVVKTEKSREDIKSYFVDDWYTEYLDSLKYELPVTRNYDELQKSDPMSVSLSIPPHYILNGDYLHYRYALSVLPNRVTRNYTLSLNLPESYLTSEKLEQFMEGTMMERALLTWQVKEQGLEHDAEFQEQYRKYIDEMYSEVFIQDFNKRDFSTTALERLNWYAEHKESLYYDPEIYRISGKKEILEYPEVKDQVKYDMYQHKYETAFNKWKEEAMERYDVTVNDNALELIKKL
jgi:hypothetical protein